MDKEKFLLNCNQNTRLKEMIQFCFEQTDWFKIENLFDYSMKQSKKRHTKEYKGKINSRRKMIKYLIKIKFLIFKDNNIKVNSKFIPLNQI